jgi:hypothetical protein
MEDLGGMKGHGNALAMWILVNHVIAALSREVKARLL